MQDEATLGAPLMPTFGDALLDPRMPMPDGIVGPDGKPAPKRFSVYRNNVTASLVEALEQTFPAVQKMLGEDYFKALARAFVAEYPPKSPVLIWYGGEFASFVEGFEPLRSYPYLADVARLEWAWLQSYHAQDADPLDPTVLAAIDPDALADLRLRLHPAAFVVCSVWPVFSIAAANRFAPEAEMAAGLNEAQSVLVTRPDLDVELLLLRPGADIFLESLAGGCPLGQAAEIAASQSNEFDLAATLGDILSAGGLGAELHP
ncbi:DNA-binding domain-containing protein [Roseibium sp.]|uniref:HvfC/BufC N-terminal domain-containing protein n=1 Tax=Roseibium sp. TaxID=1936156 RepID=UPI003A96A79A